MEAQFVQGAFPDVDAVADAGDGHRLRRLGDLVELLVLLQDAVHVEVRVAVGVENGREIDPFVHRPRGNDLLVLAPVARTDGDLVLLVLDGQFIAGRFGPIRHRGEDPVVVVAALVFGPDGNRDRRALAERAPRGVVGVFQPRGTRAVPALADGAVVRVGRSARLCRGQPLGRFRLVRGEVPHGAVAGRRPDRVRIDCGKRGRIRRAVVHREGRRRAGDRRDAHPDERLAGRVPGVDLVRNQIAVRVRETDVGTVRRAVGVVEADGRIRREPHEDGEVRERCGAGVAGDRHLTLL